jgi:nitrate reductase NapE component
MAHTSDHHTHETAAMHDAVDSWHDHSKDEKPQHAHAEIGNAGKVIGVGLGLFGVIVVAVIAAYMFWIWQITDRASRMERTSGASSPLMESRLNKSEALTKIESGGTLLIEATAQTPRREVQILPMSRAIELVQKEYKDRGTAK